VKLGDAADNTWDCMTCGIWFDPSHPQVKIDMLKQTCKVAAWYLDEPNGVTIKRVKELLCDAIALATE